MVHCIQVSASGWFCDVRQKSGSIFACVKGTAWLPLVIMDITICVFGSVSCLCMCLCKTLHT